MTIEITRTEHDAASLRRLASRSGSGAVSRRLLALALVLEGVNRTNAARQSGMDRQTLRDWVHRYNAEGVPGLADRPHGGGAPGALSEAQLAQLASWVSEGPDLARDGVVRWRCADLKAKLAQEFDIQMHERSVGRVLHRLGFAHVSARPRHPQSDPDAQAAHKKTSPP